MMGRKARVFAPISEVTLEGLVPIDHFNRHLERSLDLSYKRELVRGRYAPGGRPAINREVFFRLQPGAVWAVFFSGIRSERQLLDQPRYNLAMRWYAGDHLPSTDAITISLRTCRPMVPCPDCGQLT